MAFERLPKVFGSVHCPCHYSETCRTLTEPEFKPVAFVYGEMAKEHVELLGRQIEIDVF